jgi:hypothetical protein
VNIRLHYSWGRTSSCIKETCVSTHNITKAWAPLPSIPSMIER